MTVCNLIAFQHILISRCATLPKHKHPNGFSSFPQKCVTIYVQFLIINTISAFTLPPSIDYKFNLWPFRTFHNTSSRLINSFSNDVRSSSIVFNACRLIWFVDPSCLKKLGSSCVCRGIKLLFSLLISTVCSAIRRIFFLIISYL